MSEAPPLQAGRVGRPHGLDGSFYVTRARARLLALGSTVTAGALPQPGLPGQDGGRWGRYVLVEEAGSGSYGRRDRY